MSEAMDKLSLANTIRYLEDFMNSPFYLSYEIECDKIAKLANENIVSVDPELNGRINREIGKVEAVKEVLSIFPTMLNDLRDKLVE